MEDKLESYRLRKRRQELSENIKGGFSSFWRMGIGDGKEVSDDTKVQVEQVKKENKPTIPTSSDDDDDEEDDNVVKDESLDTSKKYDKLQVCCYFLYFMIWITLYAIAIKLEFGVVFIMISMLVGICVNTRSSKRKKNEPSAYSVFNQNCESIDGTFKAEMFEKQMGLRQL
ncbi:unnamed protein product [Diamesa serratosioi]